MLINEISQKNRTSSYQVPKRDNLLSKIPDKFLRHQDIALPNVSELQAVRHFTCLSRKNFSIDTNFYPLGSCTMKYNPRAVQHAALLDKFKNIHPLQNAKEMQGTLQILYELQMYLADITGMKAVCLTPMAGAQGEFSGVAMIKAYHASRGENFRDEILIPDAAHGTNPATATMCGYKSIEVPTAKDGDLDLEQLARLVGPKTAGIMLTNPSTLGLFIRQIKEVQSIVHKAGGLLYYDGANLNAILGKVKPGDMGFDVMHLNLHKTFATPHGGGGPGSGPIALGERLVPFTPIPTVLKNDSGYYLSGIDDFSSSIGRLSAFMGNVGILLRAYFYIRLLGRQGLNRVSEFSTLNANYLLKELTKSGYKTAYPERRASHEFIISLKEEKKLYGITAMDVAKRLLDFKIHAPTTYFPLLVPECLLIEPTETESKEELDKFIEAMQSIRHEMKNNPEVLKSAPHTMPVKRLDEVKAARDLNLTWNLNE